MADVQADRVIDRLMAERQRALDKAATQEGERITAEVSRVEETMAQAISKPPRRSEIMKIIDEKGEVSVEDLQRLIAKDVRRGI